MATDFFRLQSVKSITKVIIFSMTAITVDKAANTIKRKNRLPQNLPPPITLKILGRVIKRRLGPLSGSTPKLKQAGKMIKPANKATRVSSSPI